ncbi:Mni1p [Arthroderma uncinatum]|uniref:Mni1p n=1 Tax=Arthroderma uncinatum TaxID=74035 RepID=UPI00144ABAE1|nr:Mni1p [Arthroderma uncinatum]KAF3482104.1 Mni1p [Arthroderma uncinatum]
MASGFTFGFGGDDLEDIEDASDAGQQQGSNGAAQKQVDEGGKSEPVYQEAEELNIDEMLSSLPSQMEFNTQLVHDSTGERPFLIGRRQLIDIRIQLMAEQDMLDEHEDLLFGLQKEDITHAVYEGGFKTWECAMDLATLLATEYDGRFTLADGEETINIIELGAGTGMPSLSLFYSYLTGQANPDVAKRRKVHFVLADYNVAVLKLATLPNILLTWYITRRNPLKGNPLLADRNAVHLMEIDQALLEDFRRDLSERGITLSFISGAWSPKFVDSCLGQQSTPEEGVAAGEQPTARERRTMILASETIYSPSSLLPFTETLISLLRRAVSNGGARYSEHDYPILAYISAKKVYFGVGGGVTEFLMTLRNVLGGRDEFKALPTSEVHDAGVGRTILRIVPKEFDRR